jgi:hypothetical protein
LELDKVLVAEEVAALDTGLEQDIEEEDLEDS